MTTPRAGRERAEDLQRRIIAAAAKSGAIYAARSRFYLAPLPSDKSDPGCHVVMCNCARDKLCEARLGEFEVSGCVELSGDYGTLQLRCQAIPRGARSDFDHPTLHSRLVVELEELETAICDTLAEKDKIVAELAAGELPTLEYYYSEPGHIDGVWRMIKFIEDADAEQPNNG